VYQQYKVDSLIQDIEVLLQREAAVEVMEKDKVLFR
jgi:hypothetical protein